MANDSIPHLEPSLMVGEDRTSSLLEARPLAPLEPDQLSKERLHELAKMVIDATWKSGLTQWSWGEGVYLLAQVRYHEVSRSEIPSQVIDWYEGGGNFTSGHINNVAPGAAAARLLSRGLPIEPTLISKLTHWIEDSESATRDANGAIEHWPGSVWADTCYMLGTFYLNLAQNTKDQNLVEFIGQQLISHYAILQNSSNHLFAHGSYRGETLWNFWGRGNAWMALSSVEFLDSCEALNINTSQSEVVKNALRGQLNSLMQLLPEYRIWDVLVDGQSENKGILETSATAGIGAAMIRAARHLPELAHKLLEFGSQACAASLTYVDSHGVLTRTSAGTVLQLVPFGYSVIRNDRLQLWGQGLALNAITALLEPSRNIVALPSSK